jgi:succinate-semialdehyde dehydrogenase/glutarate-semialdehyde dehydrogenase
MMDCQDLRCDALIANAWVAEAAGRRYTVTSPATGEVIASVADCGAPEAAAALRAATCAFPAWRDLTASQRAQFLMRWHALLLEHREALAALIVREQGKVLAESRGEVDYGASYVQWFAEEARRSYGMAIPEPVPGRRLLATREPVGVVALITPWNFPFAMLARKIAPALAAGCTVVARPAEDTPLVALAMADLAVRAGLPAGVLNVVPSSRERVQELTEVWMASEEVRKVSFTGSTAVGRKIAERATGTLKKVSLELGGNAPFIVFEDADLEAAVAGAVKAKFRNNGQTCVSPNRFLVHEAVYDEFAARLTQAVQQLVVGDPSDAGTQVGPLIHAGAVAKVGRHVQDAVTQGGQVLAGGAPVARPGCFFAPTVIAEAHTGMQLAQEETFGPVAALFRFHDEAQALQRANDTPYGLAAYFYTNDARRIWRVGRRLEAGMVGINEALISTEVAPFGGIKQSGQGREGSWLGMDDYLEVKYLCIGGLDT